MGPEQLGFAKVPRHYARLRKLKLRRCTEDSNTVWRKSITYELTRLGSTQPQHSDCTALSKSPYIFETVIYFL